MSVAEIIERYKRDLANRKLWTWEEIEYPLKREHKEFRKWLKKFEEEDKANGL